MAWILAMGAVFTANGAEEVRERDLAADIVERIHPDGRRSILVKGRELVDRTPAAERAPGAMGEADRERGFVIYRRPASDGVFLRSAPRSEERAGALETGVSLGERRHVQFVVYALRDLEEVRVHCGEFRASTGATLPADGVTVRPARIGLWQNYWNPFFVERFKLIDAPGGIARVAVGESQPFWVTVRSGEEQEPGEYTGKLTVRARGRRPVDVVLKVTVLPFRLADGIWWGVYYYPGFNENTPRDFADMKAHGVNAMLICPPGNREPALERQGDRIAVSFPLTDKAMAEFVRQGFERPAAYYPRMLSCRVLDLFGRVDGETFKRATYYGQQAVEYRAEDFPEDLKPVLMDLFRQMVAHSKEAGWPEILWYLVDEPGAAGSHTMEFEWAKLEFELFRKACPDERTLCTAYSLDVMKSLDPWVDMRVADMWSVASQEGNRVIRGHVQESGDELWGIRWLCQYNTYLFPRYFAGMGPVKLGLTGMTEWTYYGAGTIGDGCNQLRSKHGCHYAYVAEDGRLLSTVTWEAVQEGIDDGRYVATLRELIDKAKASDVPEHRRLGEESETKLQEVMEGLPWGAGKMVNESTLDEIRKVIADEIVRLVEVGIAMDK